MADDENEFRSPIVTAMREVFGENYDPPIDEDVEELDPIVKVIRRATEEINAERAAEAKAEQEKKQQEQKQNAQTSKTDAQQSAQVNAQGGTKMKFCQNCGSQLQEGAKFCPNCGTPTGQVANAGANANQNANNANVRKQEFVGTIRKCPSCGAEVPAFAVTCPTCGHELNDARVSDSLKKFQEGLIKYEGKQERDFVASFPIPNTREELGNFMLMLASILNTDLQNGADSLRVSAFKSKFDEVKSKIEINFPENDPLKIESANWDKKINSKLDSWKVLNEKIIKEQQKEDELRKKRNIKEQKKEAMKKKFKYWAPAIPFSTMFVAGIFYLAISGINDSKETNKENTRLEKVYSTVREAIVAEDYATAELEIGNLVWTLDISNNNMDVDKRKTYKQSWQQKRQDLQNLIDEGKRKKRK